MKFIIVEDREIREKLLAASYDQRQVVDASQLIVLCSRTDVDSKDVSSYMENIANTRDQKLEEVEGFGEFILQSVQDMDTTDILEWNRKQTYIALGHLLHTCASLRIDSTPMEGFQPDEYNRILGLTEDGYEATLVCPIGYRHAEDAAQYKKKVRRKNDELFSTK